MKPTLIALSLFAVTGAAVMFYPASRGAVDTPPDPPLVVPSVQTQNQERPLVEVVFVLDTTGSMSGLIQAAKDKIWSIASTLAAAQPTPELRMGLVAYRDRGDAYVTRVVDLSADLDSMYATLMEFQAAGGGDGPESVNQALHEAVERISWSQNPQTYRTIFLVGDAPPHHDYANDVPYSVSLAAATERGIVVNTIQCGSYQATTHEWQRIAQLGAGRYFRVDQAGSAIALTTPYDARLAELSAALDRTRLSFGNEAERAAGTRKQEAAEKLHASSSPESRARRATFNSSAGGERNLLGENELVDAVTSGRVDLDALPEDQLPEPLRPMAPAEQQAYIEETARRRDELRRQIDVLARERETYLHDQVEALDDAEESLDHKIYSAVRAQAEDKGLRYEAEAPKY